MYMSRNCCKNTLGMIIMLDACFYLKFAYQWVLASRELSGIPG